MVASSANLKEKIFLNPTLEIRSICHGRRGSKWNIQLWTKNRGPYSYLISNALAEALIFIQLGKSPKEILADEVIKPLTEKEIIIKNKPDPKPVYSSPVIPQKNTKTKEIFKLVLNLDPSFSIYGTDQNIILTESAPWGGLIAQYNIDFEVAQAYSSYARNDPFSVSRRGKEALFEVGCVATEREISLKKRKRRRVFKQAFREFREKGRCFIPDPISSLELSALKSYCKKVKKRGYLDGDFFENGKQRSHVFDDPELTWLHSRLTPLITKLVGIEVEPSYTFLAFYHGSGDVPAHFDRPNCFVTISLAIDASSLQVLDNWPLIIEYPSGSVENVVWNIGKAVLIKGSSIKHYRPPLMEGAEATHLILHYRSSS